ncbi:MAG: RagB/SusD family nutrient uptake outer membrane protein [Bacteroidota bacterium]|nr:RagB/SusD family nutrient uptake outer membrane protein [Bacteroidota bacterium]
MKFKQIIIAGVILSISLFSCTKNFMDERNIETDVNMTQLYTYYAFAQNAVTNLYSYLPDGFWTSLYMEGATDNAEITDGSNKYQQFNSGGWSQLTNPDDVWSNYFTGIRNANLYLANWTKVDIKYIQNGITGTDSTAIYNARLNVKYLRAQAIALKAYFYFELIKRYGGVPIIDIPLDYSQASSWKNLKRNTLDECVKYISTLCDTAAAIIPVTPPSWYEAGRLTNGAILSLKSRLLLYAASPAYAHKGTTTTWADAAKAGHDVIALGKYSLVAGSSYGNLFGSSNTTQTELIFYKRYGSINTLEKANYPISFDATNGNSLTPSQNLVDAFEVVTKSGSTVTGSAPFDWNNPAHVASIYSNRDVRFAATVAYNGMTFNSTTLQTFTGGTSGQPNTNATKTGYYLKKYINSGLDLTNNTSANHSWVYFRYAEILLNYAEAMFNAYGESGNPFNDGKTALWAINQVRSRAGVYPVQTGQLTLAKIKSERRVELCFEDHRFWDVRRWEEGATYFTQPIRRVEITNTGTTALPVYSYVVKTLENRTYDNTKMDWYPIPQDEISVTGWAQNTGW